MYPVTNIYNYTVERVKYNTLCNLFAKLCKAEQL